MSASAWVLLVVTWSVVIGVSGYLFWKVVTRPRRGAGDGEAAGVAPAPHAATDPPVAPAAPQGETAETEEEPRRPS